MLFTWEFVSTYSCSPYTALELWSGVDIIILTFKWSFRAEVVTYRSDAALGSLDMQQLHGFDELRNNQGVIRKYSAKMDTTAVSLCLSASYFSFRFLPLAKIIERMGNGKKSCFLVVRIEVKKIH
jgi:hypothetical protein